VVDYRSGFKAIRRDPKWMHKIALGALIALIPYVGQVWMLGWELEYQRNVAWGQDERLPSWSDFSGQAMQGLRAYVAILPYSLALSLVIIPAALVVPILASMGSPDPAAMGLGMALGIGTMIIVLLGLVLLIIPLTSSVMLRVALYGTFESGFQLKETWRLMRESRRDLYRAWRFSSVNIGISLGAMILYFGLVGLMMALIPGPLGQKALAIAVLGSVAYFGYIFLGMALGLYLGLANMHYFGSYGRAAYRLAERVMRNTSDATEDRVGGIA
jgi:hypothetical protein